MKRQTLTNNPTAKKDSIWAATAKMPTCGRLTESLEADVCIVGAGIAGLTTAYLLTKAGKGVVVLDDGPLAGGMTQVTTAHLSNVIDDRFVNIERWHGEQGARLAAESHAAAIDRIEELRTTWGWIATLRASMAICSWRRGTTRTCSTRSSRRPVAAGVDVELVPKAPLQGFDTGPCLRISAASAIPSVQVPGGLAEAIRQDGGRLFTKSHVDSIEGGDDAKVKVGPHKVSANAVVVATNSPINDMVAIHTKQAPYMTYVIGARVPRGSVTDALYWDTLKAYHYVRLQELDDADEDLLIVGGEDHKTGQADDSDERHARLEAWARERFPMIGKIEFTWGGQCMETIDGLAFIGRNPLDEDNVFIATGDSGMGITHGTIAGMLLTDLILKRPNPWEQLYDPSRKTLRRRHAFAKENLNVAAQYADWLTGRSELRRRDPRGGGAVMRRGLSKVAVHRDDAGQTTEFSAVCPHLGCIVHWNDAESSWDCPCHGSRFHADGKVVNGPANVDLPRAED